MSKIEFTATKFHSTHKNEKIDTDNIKDILTTTIERTALIPVALLTEIGKEFTKHGARSSFRGNLSNSDALNSKGHQLAARQITASVTRITNAHFAYYKALLISMDNLLKDPEMPARQHSSEKKMESFHKDVRLDISMQGLASRTETIQLKGQWKGLSKTTMEAKTALGAPEVFWKHTGEASAAFSAAVSTRLTTLRKNQFVTSSSSNIASERSLVKGESAEYGAGAHVASANYRFTIGVPNWNPEMDTLISVPFATLKSVSTLTGSGLLKRLEADAQQAQLLRQEAFSREAEKGTASRNDFLSLIHKYNIKTSELTGINRILMAEAHRPWLRDLSAQAGSRLRAYVTGQTVTAGTSVTGLAAHGKHQATLAKLRKARDAAIAKNKAIKKAERKAITAKNTAERDAPRLAREAEAKRWAALTPAQQQAERSAVLAAKNLKLAQEKQDKQDRKNTVKIEKSLGKVNSNAKDKAARAANFGKGGQFEGKSELRRAPADVAKAKASKPKSNVSKPPKTDEEKRLANEAKFAAKQEKKYERNRVNSAKDKRSTDQVNTDILANRISKAVISRDRAIKTGRTSVAEALTKKYSLPLK